MILAPALMKKKEEDNDATRVCLEHIELDADKYRMGHTKVASTQAPTFCRFLCRRCRLLLVSFGECLVELWSAAAQ